MPLILALILLASCGASGAGGEFAQVVRSNGDVHSPPHDWPVSDEQETAQNHNDDEVLLLQLWLNVTSADSVVHLNFSQAVGQHWWPPKVLGPGNRTIEEVRASQDDTMALICMAVFLAVLLVASAVSSGPIGDSLIACTCFGSNLFLVTAYNAMFAEGIYAFLQGKFVITGFAGVIMIALLYEGSNWAEMTVKVRKTLHRKFNTEKMIIETTRGLREFEMQSMEKLSTRQTFLYLVGPGLAQVCFEIAASVAYVNDIEAAGVNSVIITSDPLVIGLFFYFYAGEKFTTSRLLGFLLVVGGNMMIAILAQTDGVSGSGLATMFSLISMLSLATCSILSRLSAMTGVRPVGASAWRCVVIGAAGLCLTYVVLQDGPTVFPGSLPYWALVGGAYDILGIYAVNRSFMHPGVITAVNGAILAACPVVSIFLCVMLLHLQQSVLKYVGAAITLSGVMLLITT